VIFAVNQWAYVVAAYAIVIATLVAYVVRTIIVGRRAGRRLPPEDRRWL
jgi:O-antigen/teichoic acid export membrane protein